MKKNKKLKKKIIKALGIFASIATIVACILALVGACSPETEPNINIGEIGDDYIFNYITKGKSSPEEKLPDLSYTNKLYSIGNEYFYDGKYEKAIEKYIEALSEHKKFNYLAVDTAKINYSLGIAFRQIGNMDGAINVYNEALGILKNEEENKLNKHDVSISEISEIRYQIGYVYFLRSIIYFEEGNYDKAKLDCERSLSKIEYITIENGKLFCPACVNNLLGEIYLNANLDGYDDENYTLLDSFFYFTEGLLLRGADTISVNEAKKMKETTIVQTLCDVVSSDLAKNEKMLYVDNDDSETALLLTNRSKVELLLGCYENVITDCQVSIKIFNSASKDERYYNIVDSYWYLAYANLFKEITIKGDKIGNCDLEEYNRYIECSFKYALDIYKENSPELAVMYLHIGIKHLYNYNFDKAANYFTIAQSMYKKLDMKSQEKTARELSNMCEICKNTTDFELSIETPVFE